MAIPSLHEASGSRYQHLHVQKHTNKSLTTTNAIHTCTVYNVRCSVSVATMSSNNILNDVYWLKVDSCGLTTPNMRWYCRQTWQLPHPSCTLDVSQRVSVHIIYMLVHVHEARSSKPSFIDSMYMYMLVNLATSTHPFKELELNCVDFVS